MAQRLVALDKQVAPALDRPGPSVLSGGLKFMTNRAEGFVMYHPPPGNHGSMANCVARLMKHLTLCLLMSERLYQSHPASGTVCLSSKTCAMTVALLPQTKNGFLPKHQSGVIPNLH